MDLITELTTTSSEITTVIDETGGDVTVNDLITIVIYCIIGTIGIIGNTLVLVVFRFLKARRSRVNSFILNQAMADLTTSLFLIAYGTTRILRTRIASGEFICRFWWSRFFVFSGFGVSTFNLTAMSLERYVAVIMPLKYPRIFSKQHTLVIMVVVWILGPMMQWTFPIFFYEYNAAANDCGVQNSFSQLASSISGMSVFLWEYFFPVIFMGFAYISILQTLKKKESQIRAFTEKSTKPQGNVNGNQPPEQSPSVARMTKTNGNKTTETSESDLDDEDDDGGDEKAPKSAIRFVETEQQKSVENGQRKPPVQPKQTNTKSSSSAAQARRRNVTLTLFIIFVVYVACWTPNQFTFLQFNFGGPLSFDGLWYHFTVCLAFLNTCVNPFIYALKHKQFQKGLMQIFKCWRDKSDTSSQVASVSGTAID